MLCQTIVSKLMKGRVNMDLKGLNEGMIINNYM